MANKLYDETSIQNIANAIRNKNGSSDLYTISQMAQAILDIPYGGGSGDITWDRTLVNEWDFTQSLNSKTGNSPFVIESGATRDSNGITLSSNADRVKLDLSTLGISDFTNVDIELDLDWSIFERQGTTREVFAVYNDSWSNYSAGLMLYDQTWMSFIDQRRNNTPTYGGIRFFDKLCIKLEHGKTTYYGMGLYVNEISTTNAFGDYINTYLQTNPYFYLGSGYSDYGIIKLRFKAMRIYERT